jgi:hypothetical protein
MPLLRVVTVNVRLGRLSDISPPIEAALLELISNAPPWVPKE